MRYEIKHPIFKNKGVMGAIILLLAMGILTYLTERQIILTITFFASVILIMLSVLLICYQKLIIDNGVIEYISFRKKRIIKITCIEGIALSKAPINRKVNRFDLHIKCEDIITIKNIQIFRKQDMDVLFDNIIVKLSNKAEVEKIKNSIDYLY